MNKLPTKLYSKKPLLLSLLAVVALYILLPQLHLFRNSLHLIPRARASDLIYATIATALTYAAASITYCLLALKPLKFFRTFKLQLASMFANRLLPAGIGGIGVNYAYLRKSKHSPSQAAGVVTANNLLGFAGHISILLVLVAVFHSQLPKVHISSPSRLKLLVIAVVVIILLLAVALASELRRRLQRSLLHLLIELGGYRRQPVKLLAGLGSSVCLTLLNVLSLWFCVRSLNLGLSFTAVLIVFTLGILIGTATPTPGGLGGIEAGLLAGLVSYRLPSAESLAIVLIYRLISYWLALIVGAVSFVFVRRQGYF